MGKIRKGCDTSCNGIFKPENIGLHCYIGLVHVCSYVDDKDDDNNDDVLSNEIVTHGGPPIDSENKTLIYAAQTAQQSRRLSFNI